MKNKVLLIFSILLLLPVFALPQIWSDVGGGLNNFPTTSLITYNNELYVTGAFSIAGGIDASGIAKWNGTQWDSLGSGATMFGMPNDLVVHNGELYAGGGFGNVGGVANTRKIAKWDGSSWSEVGGGGTGTNTQKIFTLAVYNGEIYAGGNILSIGGIGVGRIARWDGNSWTSMLGGVSGGFGEVRTMAVYNGELYVGGDFTIAGGVTANYIARWNGSQWDSVGSGLNYVPVTMTVDSVNNELYVGGGFSEAGGIPAMYVAKWDGLQWSAVGAPITAGISALTFYDGELYAGGGSMTGSVSDTVMAKWDGTSWTPLTPGPNGQVQDFHVFGGDLFLGGYFDLASSVTVNYIAKFDDNVGVDEVKKNENLLGNCIPNPAHNEVRIPYTILDNRDGNILLHNLSGALVDSIQAKANSDEIVISLEGIADGTYIYSLELEGVVVDSKRLVVAR